MKHNVRYKYIKTLISPSLGLNEKLEELALGLAGASLFNEMGELNWKLPDTEHLIPVTSFSLVSADRGLLNWNWPTGGGGSLRLLLITIVVSFGLEDGATGVPRLMGGRLTTGRMKSVES